MASIGDWVPHSLSVHLWLFFLWKSGFKFEHFQNGVFRSRQLYVNFPIRQFFVQTRNIQNRGKLMLNCGKLIIVNFALLSDIDNRKPLTESGAAYVIHFLFLAGVSVVFSLGNQPFHFTKK